MNKMSELILLTDVHGLYVSVAVTLIQNAGKSALEIGRGMKLKDAVVQECAHPLRKLLEGSVYRLLLLEVQVRVLVQSCFKYKVRVTVIFLDSA